MPPVDAEENPPSLDGAEAIIATARLQLGKPYKLGKEGPDQFDCSGLVWFCFKQNGLESLIGNTRRRAQGYYNWFKGEGKFVSSVFSAERGDLVVYGTSLHVTHIGIFLGSKRAISALVNPFGVTRHTYNKLPKHPVLGFLKVDYEI